VVGRRGRGPAWRVANYEGHGFGRTTLRTATALSINTVYAGLLLRLGGGDADRGARAVVGAARRIGVASPLPPVPSAVLGTGEVTPLEMASAYATLAAKGRRAARSGCARSPAPTAASSTRPDPTASRWCRRGWPRSPPTCCARWSTTAPAPAAGSAGRRRPGPAPPRTTPTPGRTCREPDGPVQGAVPALVGLPVARAAAGCRGPGGRCASGCGWTTPPRPAGCGAPAPPRGPVPHRQPGAAVGQPAPLPISHPNHNQPTDAGEARPGRPSLTATMAQAALGGRGGSELPPHGSGTTATHAATFFCRTVSSTVCACWSTKRVNSCWA
jgi:hypothetical protein